MGLSPMLYIAENTTVVPASGGRSDARSGHMVRPGRPQR